jgi:outer membrane receptor protein involved in Fe transport
MRTTFTLFFSLFCVVIGAQNATLQGRITDATSKEPLAGVTVRIGTTGAISSLDGDYKVSVPAGAYTLRLLYTGYADVSRDIRLSAGETLQLNIEMGSSDNLLEQTTVTAGKFEKPLGEVTVSLDILKPRLIESVNTTSIDEVLVKVPGVTILDGQAVIRGGAGYSYGAGTRVLLLLDDIPVLQPDAGFPNWDDLPVENINQIEVLKGAASALYGSSAMNGIINLRTTFAKDQPETQVAVFGKMWGAPSDPARKWWGNDSTWTPFESGISLIHRRKIGKLDVVASGYSLIRDSYSKETYSRYVRFSPNLRYRVNDRLTLGLNMNFNWGRSSSFFIWENDSTGAYLPGLNSVNRSLGRLRFNVDPTLQYFDRAGNRHKILSRMLYVNNNNTGGQSNFSRMLYGEYQFQRQMGQWVATAGVVGITTYVDAELYGNSTYSSANGAAYLQFDWKPLPRLNLSGGVRYEYNALENSQLVFAPGSRFDTIAAATVRESKPVFRFGANYQIGRATYLRSSWGQAYRYPTVAEKFISTNFGGANSVVPNPDLVSETGWSAEVGIKQGFKLGKWQGYLDVAAFQQEYNNMMEFVFSRVVFNNGALGAEFQSQNQGDTRIRGLEISLLGQGNIGKGQLYLLGGYTYLQPRYQVFNRDAGFDPKVGPLTRFWGSSDTTQNILKYRFRHQFKVDVEYVISGLGIGASLQHFSHMEAIDGVFEVFLPGIKSFRTDNNSGFNIVDFRASYQISKVMKVSAIAANALNAVYALRPAQLEAPRSYTVRLDWKF